ncbi:DUF2178 domain-containing protein [Microgenomates group bacterium]|nr:DUF2178 domain-containing protein [Microgenomates group bacterium]
MKKNFLSNVVVAVVMLGAVALQFITGSIEVSVDFMLPFLGSLLAMFLVLWFIRRRRTEMVIDERTKSVMARANGMTVLMVVVGGLVGSNIAGALTPYYPELKVVTTTLLWVTVAASLMRGLFYLWYDKKMS